MTAASDRGFDARLSMGFTRCALHCSSLSLFNYPPRPLTTW